MLNSKKNSKSQEMSAYDWIRSSYDEKPKKRKKPLKDGPISAEEWIREAAEYQDFDDFETGDKDFAVSKAAYKDSNTSKIINQRLDLNQQTRSPNGRDSRQPSTC